MKTEDAILSVATAAIFRGLVVDVCLALQYGITALRHLVNIYIYIYYINTNCINTLHLRIFGWFWWTTSLGSVAVLMLLGCMMFMLHNALIKRYD